MYFNTIRKVLKEQYFEGFFFLQIVILSIIEIFVSCVNELVSECIEIFIYLFLLLGYGHGGTESHKY